MDPLNANGAYICQQGFFHNLFDVLWTIVKMKVNLFDLYKNLKFGTQVKCYFVNIESLLKELASTLIMFVSIFFFMYNNPFF